MNSTQFMTSNQLRYEFSLAMSQMYQTEVPLYTDLIDLVTAVNTEVLNTQPAIKAQLERTGELARLGVERHGAIRLGNAQELAMMRRLFMVLGMLPVSYYDLSSAGVPVHSTAFRAIETKALSKSPFRVFTSLLRLDLIEDMTLRAKAEAALNARSIFTERVIALINMFETAGGLTPNQGQEFIHEALETFRWHHTSPITKALYQDLQQAHPLIADIVGFKGPHINHLTPRTLDIDVAQQRMQAGGIPSKDIIEGPPPRQCPLLLRQTSFKALQESVNFKGEVDDTHELGQHTARFGEIEQRGIALTPKGRALYDALLSQSKATLGETPNGSNAERYYDVLRTTFAAFPDDYQSLYEQQLAYFSYYPVLPSTSSDSITSQRNSTKSLDNDSNALQSSNLQSNSTQSHSTQSHHKEKSDINILIKQGSVRIEPIIYEDFLPVSAAGIFQSNLASDDATQATYEQPSYQAEFEQALGSKVYDEFELYDAMQSKSLEVCLKALNR